LISLESGNPVDTTSRANSNFRRLFMGKTRAFIEATSENKPAQLVLGAILGDQSLFLSKTISIVADQIQLQGERDSGKFEIKYTLDGSNPLTNGISYAGPFEIVDGTTVKAAVIRDSQTLFVIEESFGEGKGIFFGDENTVNPWESRGYALQAEDATFVGAKRQTIGKNYSGEAFLDFGNKEGSVIWYQENDGPEGAFHLKFKFAHNNQGSKCPMELIVNDNLIKVMEFDSTGSWNSLWKEIDITVKLRAGANHIELKSMGQGTPNVDVMIIE
jgi:beta-galactosidase